MGSAVIKQTSYQLDFYSPEEIAELDIPTAVLDDALDDEYNESLFLTEPSKEMVAYSPTRSLTLSSRSKQQRAQGMDPKNPSGSVWQEQGASQVIRYETLEPLKLIGIGGYGFVYLMQRRYHPEDTYCVKHVYKHVASAAMFEAEKNALIDLQQCPFVVRFKGALQTKDIAGLVLEYCIGGDLFRMVDHRPHNVLDEDEARFYIAELIVCLEAIHKKGYIYRDLKLENIMVDAEGHVALVDFGTVTKKTHNGRAYTSIGTRPYLAPEMLHKDAIIRGYTDIVDWWALGCVAYELLVGKPPFGSDKQTAYDIYTRARKTTKLEMPKFVLTRNAKNFVRKLLKPATGDRLKSGKAIRSHPWFLGVEWNSVRRRWLRPPFVPNVRHIQDTRFFDEIPDKMMTPKSFERKARNRIRKELWRRKKITSVDFHSKAQKGLIPPIDVKPWNVPQTDRIDNMKENEEKWKHFAKESPIFVFRDKETLSRDKRKEAAARQQDES